MDVLFKKLSTLLEDQIKIFKKMLELARNKQQVLVKGSIETLDQLTKDERKILTEISQIEQERMVTTQKIAEALNLKEDKIRMTDLLGVIPGEYKVSLEEMHHELLRILSELEEINEQNTELINNSLKVVNFSLNLLTEDKQKSPTYSNKGEDKAQMSKISRILDKRV